MSRLINTVSRHSESEWQRVQATSPIADYGANASSLSSLARVGLHFTCRGRSYAAARDLTREPEERLDCRPGLELCNEAQLGIQSVRVTSTSERVGIIGLICDVNGGCADLS